MCISKIQELVLPFCKDIKQANQIFDYMKNDYFMEEVLITYEAEQTQFQDRMNRSGSFFFGNPKVNKQYPWIKNEVGEGWIPLLQLNLLYLQDDLPKEAISDQQLKQWLKDNFNSGKDRKGLLQVWSDSFFLDETTQTQIRLLPEIDFEHNRNLVPKKFVGELLPEEFPEFFAKQGIGVVYKIRDRHTEKPKTNFRLDLFESDGPLFELLGFFEILDDVPSSVLDDVGKIEKELQQMLKQDDIPENLVPSRSHFFGGCNFTKDIFTSLVPYIEGGWKLLLQFPESFEDVSSLLLDDVDLSFPIWEDRNPPALFYRFVEGQGEPEFMVC
jgi:hypothetical protein